MSSDPPRSVLITPDRRRRLQQRYEEAQRFSAQSRPDFRRIHDLLAECVRADPGNPLYLEALLANLRQREAAEKAAPWWRRWLQWRRGEPSRDKRGIRAELTSGGGSKGTEDSVLSTEQAALIEAPGALWQSATDPRLYCKLSAAAGANEFDEVELRYLAAARDLAPDDPDVLRELARALTRQGRFEEAVGPWFAVVALKPGDTEAEKAIDDLRGAAESVEAPANRGQRPALPMDSAALVGMAHEMQNLGAFHAAEEYLVQAQAAAGGDLALLEMREELRLTRSEHRLAIARRREASDRDPRAARLVGRLEEEHNRLAIDLLGARAERLPGDWAVRLELARRLKRAGNFSGAIQRLEEAARQQPAEAAILVELGECWQHLRQFDKALAYYQEAISDAGSTPMGSGVFGGNSRSSLDDPAPPKTPDPLLFDPGLLARYRAAVLAAAMGKLELAREQLAAIVAVDPSFKDARERLDKLGLS